MSICSATAAASSRPRGRPGRSASSARASITEQLMMHRPDPRILDSRKSSNVSSAKSSNSNLCCVILLLTVLTLTGVLFEFCDAIGWLTHFVVNGFDDFFKDCAPWRSAKRKGLTTADCLLALKLFLKKSVRTYAGLRKPCFFSLWLSVTMTPCRCVVIFEIGLLLIF